MDAGIIDGTILHLRDAKQLQIQHWHLTAEAGVTALTERQQWCQSVAECVDMDMSIVG